MDALDKKMGKKPNKSPLGPSNPNKGKGKGKGAKGAGKTSAAVASLGGDQHITNSGYSPYYATQGSRCRQDISVASRCRKRYQRCPGRPCRQRHQCRQCRPCKSSHLGS